jgi:DnaJ-class molecular chaperone
MHIFDDFASVEPSVGELLDHIAQNFLGFHRKSGGPRRRLGVEVVLTPNEARTGVVLPIDVPRYDPCPRCGGADPWWGLCLLCNGYGVVEGSARIALRIPPWVRSGERFEVPLDDVGIGNLVLDVSVFVA